MKMCKINKVVVTKDGLELFWNGTEVAKGGDNYDIIELLPMLSKYGFLLFDVDVERVVVNSNFYDNALGVEE